VPELPRTMKAAILVEQNQPLVVAEVELPEALGVGQVLVKIHYSGICGSQLGEIDGVKGEDRFLPHLLGHEGSGIVLAVGPGVRHVEPDDTVVLHWRKGLGIDSETPTYRWGNREVSAGCLTTFNEYALVSENRCTPIPSDSDLQVAALFGCAVTTGFGVVENNARLRIGESIVALGVGGVGLNIVQAASLVSAHPIIAVDLHENRLDLARKMGATHLVNASEVNVQAELESITGSAGVDVAVDSTGLPEMIQLGYRITKPMGRVVLVGVPLTGDDIELHSLPLHFGKQLSGSHGGDGDPHVDIPRYHGLYRSGRIRLRELITDVVGLDDINEAVRAMRAGDVSGRCMVSFDD
jgi:S-(hydroxymethyl)glutathione dehydrogenase/alcohol dehydrogenase